MVNVIRPNAPSRNDNYEKFTLIEPELHPQALRSSRTVDLSIIPLFFR